MKSPSGWPNRAACVLPQTRWRSYSALQTFRGGWSSSWWGAGPRRRGCRAQRNGVGAWGWGELLLREMEESRGERRRRKAAGRRGGGSRTTGAGRPLRARGMAWRSRGIGEPNWRSWLDKMASRVSALRGVVCVSGLSSSPSAQGGRKSQRARLTKCFRTGATSRGSASQSEPE